MARIKSKEISLSDIPKDVYSKIQGYIDDTKVRLCCYSKSGKWHIYYIITNEKVIHYEHEPKLFNRHKDSLLKVHTITNISNVELVSMGNIFEGKEYVIFIRVMGHPADGFFFGRRELQEKFASYLR